jgi:hypothetical protein
MLQFEVGLGLGRIGVILWSFLVILPPILPQILSQSYQKVVEITGLIQLRIYIGRCAKVFPSLSILNHSHTILIF